jgi:cytochrome c-type biogenesis protein CcmE
MNPNRKQRLIWVIAVVAGVGIAVAVLLYALGQNINLFFSPTQIAAGEAPLGSTIRVGGLVQTGSVQKPKQGVAITFVITDNAQQITVRYAGLLPDLFREGQGVVAIGKLNADQIFEASEVLAKHDETYMPPEVYEALKASAEFKGAVEADTTP